MSEGGVMAEPKVTEREIVMVDKDGNVTKDKTRAVSGEVIETLDDGTKRSIMFEVAPDNGSPQ